MKSSQSINSAIDLAFLYGGIVIYSINPVMNKLASMYSFPSFLFLLFYGAGLVILAIYAVLWQQTLKRFSLITAYSNRPLVTVLGMLWGSLFFHESITANMLVGTVVIVGGIRMVVTADDL